MAKQEGLVKLTGTIGNITFYKMNGEYYARAKSTLSGKRVKKDVAFGLTRVYARRLGLASAAAKKCYRALPERNVQVYRKMVSEALRLLKTGCPEEQLESSLRAIFRPPAVQRLSPEPDKRKMIPLRPRLAVSTLGRLQKQKPGREEPISGLKLFIQESPVRIE